MRDGRSRRWDQGRASGRPTRGRIVGENRGGVNPNRRRGARRWAACRGGGVGLRYNQLTGRLRPREGILLLGGSAMRIVRRRRGPISAGMALVAAAAALFAVADPFATAEPTPAA